MDTEELTSFFELLEKKGLNNQNGGSILESIETKKFSMYGGEEKNVESFDKKIEIIVSKMNELKEKHNELLKSEQKKLQDSEGASSKLKSEFDIKSKDMDELSKKLDEMSKMNENLNKEKKELTDNKKELEKYVKEKEDLIERIKSEFQDLQRKRAEAQKIISDESADITDLFNFESTIGEEKKNIEKFIDQKKGKSPKKEEKVDPFKIAEKDVEKDVEKAVGEVPKGGLLRGGDNIDDLLNFTETYF